MSAELGRTVMHFNQPATQETFADQMSVMGLTESVKSSEFVCVEHQAAPVRVYYRHLVGTVWIECSVCGHPIAEVLVASTTQKETGS